MLSSIGVVYMLHFVPRRQSSYSLSMPHVQLVVHLVDCYIFVTTQTPAGPKPRSPARPRCLRSENFFSLENCRKEAPEQALNGVLHEI